MARKNWDRINWRNAKLLRERTSIEQRRFLADMGDKIYLRRQQGLTYGEIIRQIREILPKGFNEAEYWANLAYEMSQRKYGGIYTKEEEREEDAKRSLDLAVEKEQRERWLLACRIPQELWPYIKEKPNFQDNFICD